MAIKASIAVMLLRLTIIRTHRIIIWAALLITEVYSTFFFFLFVFQCQPSNYFWTQFTGGKGACMDPQIIVSATYGYSVIVCLTDWIMAIMPFVLVWSLQMTRKSKLLVGGILAMGAIASTATIIRIPYLHTLSNKQDFLYATTDVAIWSGVETGLGITAACLATLRPLLRDCLANTRFRSAHTRPTHISQPMPWTGGGGQSHGYIRSNSQAGRPLSPGVEALGMKGIQKTTRVSIDAYGPWAIDLETCKDVDRLSAGSISSKTHIANCVRRS